MHNRNFLLLLALALLAACQPQVGPQGKLKVGKPYVIDGKTYYPSFDSSYDKIGEASWYGPGFHGKYTASGETFNQDDLTAAHPTLPMPSLIRVTNLENGKSSIVRVNDRGPFKRNRIIDLSKKSAETLGIKSLGRVRVQFLKDETEQYIASFQGGGKPPSMEEVNAHGFKPKASQIVEETDATTHAGQIVSDAAPVMTVASDDLAGQQQKTETPPQESAEPIKEIPDPRDITSQRLISAAVAEELPPSSGAAPQEEPPVTVADDNYVPPVVPYSGVTILPNETIVETPPPQPAPEPAAQAAPPEPAPVVSEAPKPEPKKAPAPVAEKYAPKAVKGGYAVQVGSFSSEENARKIADKLAKGMSEDFKPSVTQTEAGGRTLWRVWVGGFPDKESAGAALDIAHSSGAPDARITAAR